MFHLFDKRKLTHKTYIFSCFSGGVKAVKTSKQLLKENLNFTLDYLASHSKADNPQLFQYFKERFQL